jgi:hypothetical protein
LSFTAAAGDEDLAGARGCAALPFIGRPDFSNGTAAALTTAWLSIKHVTTPAHIVGV